MAYGQFCRHFLAPLALAAYKVPLALRMMQVRIDGIPLGETCRLLPFKARLNGGLLLHLFLHSKSEMSGSATVASDSAATMKGFSRDAMLGLIDSLKSCVAGIGKPKVSSYWSLVLL